MIFWIGFMTVSIILLANYPCPNFKWGTTRRIRQGLRKIDSRLQVLEPGSWLKSQKQLTGLIEEKFESRKVLAGTRLILKRTRCGVSARTISQLFC
jgi:hypothetical protein